MGGLVARSACHCAIRADRTWLGRLKQLVFLGTPHQGAPLERAGNGMDILLGISPYTEPFAQLGQIRSAGVKDFRYGYILNEDWERGLEKRGSGMAHGPGKRLPGDGLVPVKSALGQHEDDALTRPIAASRQEIFYGLNHFDLLSSHAVCDRIQRWLSTG